MEIINEEMGIALRKMNSMDTLDVYEIEKICYTSPWPLQAFEESLQHHESLVLYLLSSSEVIGFFIGNGVQTEYSVYNIAINPAYQRRGYAYFILNSIIYNHFKKYENYFLEVRKSNKEAISLYCKLGFRYLYQRKDYYSDPVEDALILRYSLSEDLDLS